MSTECAVVGVEFSGVLRNMFIGGRVSVASGSVESLLAFGENGEEVPDMIIITRALFLCSIKQFIGTSQVL
jgi:hypothetical protein